jgi:hypothetical protein
MNIAMRISLTGRNTPALRVVTRDQLAQALHAKTSPIIIWNSNLAAPFARLLWVQKLRWSSPSWPTCCFTTSRMHTE